MVSIPIYHAGEPSSIPGNGAVSAANAMSFTSGLLQMIPHSHMPNALFVAPDALTISNCSNEVSIPACHAGDPGSIPGNGAKGGANATSFTRLLLHILPHSDMPNVLFVAPDALTLSKHYWVQWVVHEIVRILPWSRPSAVLGIAAHTPMNFPVHW